MWSSSHNNNSSPALDCLLYKEWSSPSTLASVLHVCVPCATCMSSPLLFHRFGVPCTTCHPLPLYHRFRVLPPWITQYLGIPNNKTSLSTHWRLWSFLNGLLMHCKFGWEKFHTQKLFTLLLLPESPYSHPEKILSRYLAKKADLGCKPSSFLFPSICKRIFTKSAGLARNWPIDPAIMPVGMAFLCNTIHRVVY